MILFVRTSPFRLTEVDVQSVISQLCTFITLFYAMLFAKDDGFFVREDLSPQDVSTGLVAIQVLPLVSAGIIVVRELVRQQKVRMAKAMMQAARGAALRLT